MNLHHRDFTVGPTAERVVSFSLDGTLFKCLPDITMAVQEEYLAGQVPDANDSTRVGIPLNVCVRFIEGCLPDGETVELFRKVRSALSLESGAETLHAIREYLVEAYAEAGPTSEPAASSPGPPVSGPTSTAGSGSPAGTPTTSPSAAT